MAPGEWLSWLCEDVLADLTGRCKATPRPAVFPVVRELAEHYSDAVMPRWPMSSASRRAA